MAIIAAVAIPALAVLACGAVDLSSLNSDRVAMQDVADASALAAAKQLGVGEPEAVIERAKEYANAQLTDVATRVPHTVSAVIGEKGDSITVTVHGHRESFFANLLPPGGWTIHVEATAANMGRTPLCVLSTDAGKKGLVSMDNASRMTAGGCLVQSNGDIRVAGSSALTAGLVQATGGATGAISPSPQIGAPSIADPFADMDVTVPAVACVPVDTKFESGVNVLAPGVHCGKFRAEEDTTIQLQPGEHYFIGKLELHKNAQLKGSDVVLVFDKDSDFKFDEQSQIRLQGRRTGAYAGFVLVTTRQNTHTFEISSDSARELLGTIYVPAATLQVLGSGNRVADQSAWTVVVAKNLKLEGSPNLVINSNYAATTVPVPAGVGPGVDARVTLTR